MTDKHSAKQTFFAEDTCTLKDDPSKIGVVDRTWHDVDFEFFSSADYNIIHDESVDPALHWKFVSTGIPPRDHAFVTFTDPSYGSSLLQESKLKLLDRSLSTGDVVKKKSEDAMSGTVIRTSAECTLEPSLPKLSSTVASNGNASDVKFGSNLIFNHSQSASNKKSLALYNISAEELKLVPDWQEDTFIIYHGWLGRVMDLLENVTIGFPNGSVVVIEQIDELNHYLKPPSFFKGPPVDIPVPGMLVQTKKSNLRSGLWKRGAHDPSMSPHGVILETSVLGIGVMWLFQYHSSEKPSMPKPPMDLDLEALESGEIVVYERGKMPPGVYIHGDRPGFVSGSNICTGDCVRFKDINSAAAKQNGSVSPTTGLSHSDLIKIADTFRVVQTSSTVTVLWQDLTKSQDWSGSLIPYLNVDDHDVWPGEIVIPTKSTAIPAVTLLELNHPPRTNKINSRTDGQTSIQDVIKTSASEENINRPMKIGVVQLVDSVERIAQVRWSTNSTLELAGENLLPGGSMGELADIAETMSVYEMTAKPGLTLRIGDFVLVFEDERQTVSGNPLAQRQLSDKATQTTIDWCGEVVELGLDGLVTVRLGASADAHDVRVPIHRVRLVAGGDDDSDDGRSSMEEDEDGWSEGSLTNSENVLEEIVEYEGGARMDTDGDEAFWATDEEDTDVDANFFMTDAETNEPLQEDPAELGRPQDGAALTSKSIQGPRPNEISLAKETDPGPDRFVVLASEPLQSHPFVNSTSDLSKKQLRRIQKEHMILQSSMPNDIYVRTWESRLDLLRVLILGPRNTPYELAPFVMDFQFGPTFPAEPPKAFFHSWTGGMGRVNPNLYEDGKICLSLLGTWPATEKHARWSEKSSMLQVLVSLMGLVLVREPYYNEAGFDILIGSSEARVNAALYTERAYVMARGFVKHALQSPVDGLDDVLRWLYHSDADGAPHLLKEVVDEARETMRRSENKISTVETLESVSEEDRPRRVSAGALRLLRNSIDILEKMLPVM